jgi:integrase
VRLIKAARGLKQRVSLMTAYLAGLRVGELVNLKITDIDAERMTLRVKRGMTSRITSSFHQLDVRQLPCPVKQPLFGAM